MPGLYYAELYGGLKNSESLQNQDSLLRHLDGSRSKHLDGLINCYPCLFSETPTHLVEPDIDVGDSKLI